MKNSQSQIVATIGPASSKKEVLKAMVENKLDVVRLNFSWGTFEERREQIKLIREISKETGRVIRILADLPSVRIQEGKGHTYDKTATASLTEKDKEFVRFGVEQNIDYFALSFVGNAKDVESYKEVIKSCSGLQKVIAKIERQEALQNLDEIIASADGIMVARGDLGDEIPMEKVPFAQRTIIHKCKEAGKPVITATQMLLSMTENPRPTRAEVTDVANAILWGSDAVMLSEESATGKYPIEVIKMMERIIIEAEKDLGENLKVNQL